MGVGIYSQMILILVFVPEYCIGTTTGASELAPISLAPNFPLSSSTIRNTEREAKNLIIYKNCHSTTDSHIAWVVLGAYLLVYSSFLCNPPGTQAWHACSVSNSLSFALITYVVSLFKIVIYRHCIHNCQSLVFPDLNCLSRHSQVPGGWWWARPYLCYIPNFSDLQSLSLAFL